MADTYLDQIVEYPTEVLKKIAEDKYCIGLIRDKSFDKVTEDDFDEALENNILDYHYLDSTAEESSAYIMVEIEVNRVENRTIKNIELYVTIACHKSFMKMNFSKFKGMIGNRRDNITRYVDKLLNGKPFPGIGTLKLKSVKTLTPINGFLMRELCYEIPDFNIVEVKQ